MTDQDLWEDFLDYEIPDDMAAKLITDPQEALKIAFLTALEIGRRERTVEIAEAWGYADVGLHDDDLEDELRRVYPDCFGEGEK